MTAPLRLGVRAGPGHPVWEVLAGLGELFTVVDGADIDAAFVAPGMGCVEELLGRGVHVLAQPLVGGRSVASALRVARTTGAHFRLLDMSEAAGPLAALARRRLGRVAEVEVVTPVAGLDTTVRVLRGVLPSLRPWRIVARTPELLTGAVAGCAVTIAVPAAGSAADLVPDRIVVRGAEGAVIASGAGLTWLPGPFGGRPDPQGAASNPRQVLRARLTDFHIATTGQRTRDAAEAQLALTVSRLAEDLVESLANAPRPPAFPPAVADEAHRAGLAQVGDPGRAVTAARELERIALATMAGVLADACGDERERTPDDILAAARIAPGAEWLVRRWIAVLVEEGVFKAVGDKVRPVRMVVEDADLTGPYAALGFPPSVADFHTRVRAALPSLMRGEAALSALLFPEGGTAIAEALYTDGWASRYLNKATASAVRAVLAGGTGTPTVLELGAGVGATTQAILTELDEARYIFSDLSGLFLVAAARRWPGHRHSLLDINGDLVAQGAPAGSADVVVAGHLLHSAANLGAALRGIHATLRTGGLLAMVDSTRENYALLASIQFLRSADKTAPRPGSADARAATGRMFPDLDGWQSELTAAGFTVHACLPPRSHGGAALGQALLLATADQQ